MFMYPPPPANSAQSAASFSAPLSTESPPATAPLLQQRHYHHREPSSSQDLPQSPPLRTHADRYGHSSEPSSSRSSRGGNSSDQPLISYPPRQDAERQTTHRHAQALSGSGPSSIYPPLPTEAPNSNSDNREPLSSLPPLTLLSSTSSLPIHLPQALILTSLTTAPHSIHLHLGDILRSRRLTITPLSSSIPSSYQRNNNSNTYNSTDPLLSSSSPGRRPRSHSRPRRNPSTSTKSTKEQDRGERGKELEGVWNLPKGFFVVWVVPEEDLQGGAGAGMSIIRHGGGGGGVPGWLVRSPFLSSFRPSSDGALEKFCQYFRLTWGLCADRLLRPLLGRSTTFPCRG
jgi:hypothetical protein